MQKIIQGEGSLQQAAGEITGAGHTSVFLITGKHFYEANSLDFLNSLQISRYLKQGANVEEQETELAFEMYKQSNASAILAIGGGSVMDLAKVILWKCNESSLRLPYLVVAPTTAGSGSEATSFAVLYKETNKISISDPSLLPVIAILDPTLTYSMSSTLTGITGMDLLAQAVESYWNIHATNASKNDAAEAIGLWDEFFIKAVSAPDPETRKNMQWAAFKAGKAINVTRTTGPHALSYYLTANHQVPHGQAVALFLPLFFHYNKPGIELSRLLGTTDYSSSAELIRHRMQKAGLATTFSELGLRKEELVNKLLRDANEERFANNPVPFNATELKKLILEYL